MSNLVDNFPEIYKKEYKWCKERKNVIQKCSLIGIKNNRLHNKCHECNNKSYKSINELDKKFPNIYQFSIGMIINVFCY